MYPEIFDAIHSLYQENPEVEVDCYLYLSNIWKDMQEVLRLGNEAEKKIKEMNRCTRCGEPMQVYFYKEPHPELDGCPMEEMTELCCPNCDIPGQIMMKEWR